MVGITKKTNVCNISQSLGKTSLPYDRLVGEVVLDNSIYRVERGLNRDKYEIKF